MDKEEKCLYPENNNNRDIFGKGIEFEIEFIVLESNVGPTLPLLRGTGVE